MVVVMVVQRGIHVRVSVQAHVRVQLMKNGPVPVHRSLRLD